MRAKLSQTKSPTRASKTSPASRAFMNRQPRCPQGCHDNQHLHLVDQTKAKALQNGAKAFRRTLREPDLREERRLICHRVASFSSRRQRIAMDRALELCPCTTRTQRLNVAPVTASSPAGHFARGDHPAPSSQQRLRRAVAGKCSRGLGREGVREKTGTRERLCLNGLQRRGTGTEFGQAGPHGKLGLVQGSGALAGYHRLHAKGFSDLACPSRLEGGEVGQPHCRLVRRTIRVPRDWAGRRIALSLSYLNSYAAVFVDGRRCAETRFPVGELDLTPHLSPGSMHTLSLHVVAMPLQGVASTPTRTRPAR